MSSRCGCPGCVQYFADCGIAIDYQRVDRCDHYTFRFDGACVAGDGLRWDAANNQLHTRLKPGGGLAFDGSGALHTVTSAAAAHPSVAALEARQPEGNVVAGGYGAGYMIKPQSSRGSLEYAVERGLEAVHVPVRMLHDGTPVITPDTHMGPQNGNTRDFGEWAEVQRQDAHRWQTVPNATGTWKPLQSSPPLEVTTSGWFGFLETSEISLLSLGDVFKLIGGQAVLILELMWPPISEDGTRWVLGPAPSGQATYSDVTDRRVSLFLKHVRRLIGAFGLTQSVIVTTQYPRVPTRNSAQPRDVLSEFSAAGITVGPVLATPKQAQTYPPDSPEWDTWTWLFPTADQAPGEQPRPANMPAGVDITTVKTYTDTGLFAMWWPVTRHSEYARLVLPSGAVGAISADPEYTAGNLPDSPNCLTCGDNSYRRHEDTFYFGTVDHGVLPMRDEAWWSEVSSLRRGWNPHLGDTNVDNAPVPTYILGPETGLRNFPNGELDVRSHFILQGRFQYQSENTEDYRLDWWIGQQRKIFGGGEAGRVVRAEVAFAVTSDHRLIEWTNTPGANNSGYIISYSTWRNADQALSEQVQILCWDQANERLAELRRYDVTSFLGDDNGWIGMRVLVNPDRIWVAFIDLGTGEVITEAGKEPWDSAADPDSNKRYLGSAQSGNRGGYVFFGRGVQREYVGGVPTGRADPAAGDLERANFARWKYTPAAGSPS